MKRSVFIGLVSLAGTAMLASCASVGITKNAKLAYDMAHDEITTSPPALSTVNEGDMVSMEITNINPFVYDVSINDKSVTYNTSIPPMLQVAALSADRIAESTTGTLTVADNGGKENMAAISHFGDMFTEFRQKFMAFQTFVTYDDYLYASLKRPFVDEAAFKEDLDKRLTEAAGGTKLYTRSDFMLKASGLFSDVSVAYYSMLAEYQKLDEASKGAVKDIFSRATGTFRELSNSASWPIKVGNTADLYSAVQSTPFKFFSFKEQAKGNAVQFVVSGHRKESTDLRGLEGVRPFTLEYTVPVEGGWQIDASAGLFLSNLVSESFAVKDEAGSQTILKKKADVLNYGPGALMHVYYRPIGVGLGLGAFTNNFANVQYILGPTLMFGGGNRFCVSGGVTMGKVTRLADGLNVGEPLVSQDPGLSSVPTIDILQLGWWVGFSYNFTSGL